MNLLNKLTIKNLNLNRKRTIVTIIGIILSVALITAVATMYASGIASLIKFETDQKGNFHTAFYDVAENDINTFKNNRAIEEIYLTKDIGYAKLKDSRNGDKPYCFIKAFTKSSLDNLGLRIVEGRLPENDMEIIIPTHLKTNGRITLNVGDNVTLEVGKRVNSKGEILNQNNQFDNEANEEVIDTSPKTYKIVGIIERPANSIENYSAPGYTFITYTEDERLQGNVDLYARYTKEGTKNAYKVTANILGVDEELFEKNNSEEFKSKLNIEEKNKYEQEMQKSKYQISINSYLIGLETNPTNVSSIEELEVVVAIVCGIIVFTSVFCIKNSFDISITEKIKQYGMLRSIGATKRQIKKNVFYEATILGLIGIPFGLAFGFIAAYILIIISNSLLENALNIKLIFTFSWLPIIVAIILGIITIYFSALRSARKASKVSPIDSIRNSGNIKIKSKKLKTPKLIRKIFGIGGEISYKNLKRNKKKYRTTVISIIVSVSVFIALFSFMGLAFKSVDNELKISEYNIILSVWTNNDDSVYDKVLKTTSLENIENYTVNRSASFRFNNAKYSKDYIEFFLNGNASNEGTIEIETIGDEQYKKYIKKLGLNYEDVKDKGILLDYVNIAKYDDEKKDYKYKHARVYDYEVNDKISGQIKENENFDIEIALITEEKPFGFKNEENCKLIISDELFDKVTKTDSIRVIYKSSNANKLQDDIYSLEILNNINFDIYNIEENVKMMNNLFTLIAIFLYGFITVITLIGITNIFNTITTNMELRRQEFAMLKSIGMTKKEFNKMIRLESIFMGLKSLIFGIPIGTGLSYLIYHYLAGDNTINYELPIIPVAVSIIAVFILITVLMKYSINKINKQNTIETIRNENI